MYVHVYFYIAIQTEPCTFTDAQQNLCQFWRNCRVVSSGLCRRKNVIPAPLRTTILFLDGLHAFLVVLEEVNEAGHQVDLRQVEQCVEDVDYLLV